MSADIGVFSAVCRLAALDHRALRGEANIRYFSKLCSPIGIPEWHRPRTEP